jgi:hypothetical protein
MAEGGFISFSRSFSEMSLTLALAKALLSSEGISKPFLAKYKM